MGGRGFVGEEGGERGRDPSPPQNSPNFLQKIKNQTSLPSSSTSKQPIKSPLNFPINLAKSKIFKTNYMDFNKYFNMVSKIPGAEPTGTKYNLQISIWA